MAERSFKSEVAKLKLGAGQEFRGEGILAVTKALLQSGVSYVSGYQGAPISHLVDVLADADDVLRELGIRFEASANEAAAAAALAASINYPLRGAATFKSTVGTNVASDALPARAGKDREALAGRGALHRGAQAQRGIRGRSRRHRHRHARRHVQHRAAGVGNSWPCRRVRRKPRAALRAQCHLPADRVRAHPLLRG